CTLRQEAEPDSGKPEADAGGGLGGPTPGGQPGPDQAAAGLCYDAVKYTLVVDEHARLELVSLKDCFHGGGEEEEGGGGEDLQAAQGRVHQRHLGGGRVQRRTSFQEQEVPQPVCQGGQPLQRRRCWFLRVVLLPAGRSRAAAEPQSRLQVCSSARGRAPPGDGRPPAGPGPLRGPVVPRLQHEERLHRHLSRLLHGGGGRGARPSPEGRLDRAVPGALPGLGSGPRPQGQRRALCRHAEGGGYPAAVQPASVRLCAGGEREGGEDQRPGPVPLGSQGRDTQGGGGTGSGVANGRLCVCHTQGDQCFHFFHLKNISFCGCHPKHSRYFGFITKHPEQQRFACHVMVSETTLHPLAESVRRAFQQYYREHVGVFCPTEDIFME
ncbi:unnamed protein product, partial [Tetraodon nigroviridis]